jgi:GntR family transcriptional regulator
MAQQPMYHRIAEDLQAKIESGKLRSGAQLPTELELREQYDASRNTIRDAIKRLISLGLVETKPGQGTFVVQKIDPFVTTLTGKPSAAPDGSAMYLSSVSEEHRKAEIGPVRVEIQAPSEEVTSRLRIASSTQVISRHQQRFIDEIPWSLQTSFYPMGFVTSGKAPRLLMAEDILEGAVEYLRETMGISQVGYRDWITARSPDQNEQVFFRIPHDATVFVIFRTGFDETGTPMRVTETVFPADRNQFIVDVGDVPEPEYNADAEATPPRP